TSPRGPRGNPEGRRVVRSVGERQTPGLAGEREDGQTRHVDERHGRGRAPVAPQRRYEDASQERSNRREYAACVETEAGARRPDPGRVQLGEVHREPRENPVAEES